MKRRFSMRILIIDADGSLKCRAMSGIEIITMKSIREEDFRDDC